MEISEAKALKRGDRVRAVSVRCPGEEFRVQGVSQYGAGAVTIVHCIGRGNRHENFGPYEIVLI